MRKMAAGAFGLVLLLAGCSDEESSRSEETATQQSIESGSGDSSLLGGRLDEYVGRFIESASAAGLTLEPSCVDGVVRRIPSVDDADRSLRNLDGEILSEEDNELVLSWIEDDLLACAPAEQLVALLKSVANSTGLVLDESCAIEAIRSATDYSDLDTEILTDCAK